MGTWGESYHARRPQFQIGTGRFASIAARVATDSSGGVCYDADFYPYGGERPYTNTCTTHYKFEGKERDAETGNDDFGARYYSNRFGRWLSSDWSAVPVAVPYANLSNPQTFNLYGMVADDPESFADLDGHCTADGEKHNWLWCAAHWAGFKETGKERQARISREREWLLLHNVEWTFPSAFQEPHQIDFASASDSEIDAQYQGWQTINDMTGGLALTGIFYRGGSSFEPKPGEYRLDQNGNVKPTHGPSLNEDPAKVEQFGGAYKVKSIPEELKIIPRGTKPGHFEVVPKQPMSVQRFVQLLREIVVEGPKPPVE